MSEVYDTQHTDIFEFVCMLTTIFAILNRYKIFILILHMANAHLY